jgi:hypothetical protein
MKKEAIYLLIQFYSKNINGGYSNLFERVGLGFCIYLRPLAYKVPAMNQTLHGIPDSMARGV